MVGQQLLANEATLWPVRQIIEDRLIRFAHIFFNLVDFQRPDRVCFSFSPFFKFTGLIQISYIDKREECLFSFRTTGLEYLVQGLEVTVLSLITAEGFFPRLVTSLLRAATTSGSLLTHEVDRWLSGISTAY